MKALKQITLKIFLLILFIQFTPGISISQPPPWAPAHGYRAKTTYIYFPQHNFYFDLNRRVYFVWVTNRWVTYTALPTRYARINLSGARQVELDVVTRYPYYYNVDHRKGNFKVKAAPAVKQKTTPANKPAAGKQTKPAPKKIYKPTNQPNPGKGKPASKPGQGKGHGNGKGKG